MCLPSAISDFRLIAISLLPIGSNEKKKLEEDKRILKEKMERENCKCNCHTVNCACDCSEMNKKEDYVKSLDDALKRAKKGVTLRYGSPDSGNTVYADIPELNDEMKKVHSRFFYPLKFQS